MAEPKLTGEKTCSKCEKPKHVMFFDGDSSSSDGLRPDCKECRGKRKSPKKNVRGFREGGW